MASEATTASEVKSDLRFGIYGSKFICYHICLDSLGQFWPFFELREKKERKKDESASTRPVGFAAGKKTFCSKSAGFEWNVSTLIAIKMKSWWSGSPSPSAGVGEEGEGRKRELVNNDSLATFF